MTFAYGVPDGFDVNLNNFPDDFEFNPAFTNIQYETSTIPTYDPTDQICLPLRHYPNDYQIESQFRQNNSLSYHQSQSRHSSNPSYNTQLGYANSMNSTSYPPNSRHAISTTNSYHTETWNLMMAAHSPLDNYINGQAQATNRSRTSSGSTDNSVSSATVARHKTRHHSTDTQAQQSSPPPSNGQRIFCTHHSCLDSTGASKHSFTRKADLTRHTKSAHEPTYMDCPWPKCERKGANGFTRIDHLKEHRRGYHMEDLEKRGSGESGGASREAKSGNGRHERR
jgi:hypothetical protein